MADVDLEAGTVFVRQSKTERGIRTVGIPTSLKRFSRLGRARLEVNPSSVLPTAQKSCGNVTNAGKQLQQIFEGSGHAWMTPHTLRTTCSTLLLNAGVEPRRVADQLGHSSPAIMLQHYAGRSAYSDPSDILDGIGA